MERKLELCEDIESQLNKSIVIQVEFNTSEEEIKLIEGVKFAISEGYGKDEILKVYNISPQKYSDIRSLLGLNQIIAPEYNEAIESYRSRKKRVKIDQKMVEEVKELYVAKSCNTLKEISEKVGISSNAVSGIINLRTHKKYGRKYHAEIREILKRIKVAKKAKKDYKIKTDRERRKLRKLYGKRREINKSISKEREGNNKLKKHHNYCVGYDTFNKPSI